MRRWPFRSKLFFLCSLGLLAFALWMNTSQPDELWGYTVWPVWSWAFPGFLLSWFTFARKSPRAFQLSTLAWLLYVLLFCEEPKSLMRGLLLEAKPTSRTITIVSINCAVARAEAAMEAAKYHPDIILLQESPSKTDVLKIAKKLFGENGSFVFGPDCSIVSKTRLEPLNWQSNVGFHANPAMTTVHGKQILVVSTRLQPVPFRLDFWSSDYRFAYYVKRSVHRQQMIETWKRLSQMPRETPVIIGGDFNSPARDGAVAILSPLYTDAFATAGRGWGNSFLNDMPVIRIDQIWTTKNLTPLSVRAYRTLNSDHRMVVAKIRL